MRDLIRRVPELQTVVSEYLNVTPLSFHIGHASKNMRLNSERMRTHAAKTGEIFMVPPEEGPLVTTYVEVYPQGLVFSVEEFNSFGFPIRNVTSETDSFNGEERYIGELTHPLPRHHWWDYIETYKSGYCGTSIIVPFWGINDPFLLHLTILYAFSIIVRYLPNKWHDIENGKFDHIRALLEHYLVIVDNVLPKIAIERLTGIKLFTTQHYLRIFTIYPCLAY